ncbi:MAG: hypothetical protein IPL72_18065, partial [Sulfuritalea sp.]|nr:hypothetical protein [Sulfuritalea sp.]
MDSIEKVGAGATARCRAETRGERRIVEQVIPIGGRGGEVARRYHQCGKPPSANAEDGYADRRGDDGEAADMACSTSPAARPLLAYDGRQNTSSACSQC